MYFFFPSASFSLPSSSSFTLPPSLLHFPFPLSSFSLPSSPCLHLHLPLFSILPLLSFFPGPYTFNTAFKRLGVTMPQMCHFPDTSRPAGSSRRDRCEIKLINHHFTSCIAWILSDGFGSILVFSSEHLYLGLPIFLFPPRQDCRTCLEIRRSRVPNIISVQISQLKFRKHFSSSTRAPALHSGGPGF
jgi:hypothetical protein